MAGPLVLEAWQYSNEKGELSREQVLSSIMLLEKEGKSTEQLNNLRPITLTNLFLPNSVHVLQICNPITQS